MSESHKNAISGDARGWPAAAASGSRPPAQPHHVLQISRDESDMERIILAAQIQLRRWRQDELAHTSFRSQQRIRQIIAARDAMLASAATRDAILIRSVPHAAGGGMSLPLGRESAAGVLASAGMAAVPE